MGKRRFSKWDRAYPLAVKFLVWVAFFAVLYLLRSFFLLVFLTFIFSYIQAHGVRHLTPITKNRGLAVVLVGLAFLGVIIAIGSFVVPRVKAQATLFADRYPLYLRTIDKELLTLRDRHSFLQSLWPEEEYGTINNEWVPQRSPAYSVLQQVIGLERGKEGAGRVNHAVELLRNIGQYLLAITSAFLLSLLFSFLIVLDLPRLSRSIEGLAKTKVAFIYEEVADTIKSFGFILGRALEAQVLIALVNTLFTWLLIHYLGLGERAAFLSIIVFFCSFIPVAGVFISSVPICLMVLQELGLGKMLLAIGCIWIIHMIEAYVLNPKIFGHHLRINPVLVLVILTIAGKLFHVWGLILGIPVSTYFFGYAIRHRESEEPFSEETAEAA